MTPNIIFSDDAAAATITPDPLGPGSPAWEASDLAAHNLAEMIIAVRAAHNGPKMTKQIGHHTITEDWITATVKHARRIASRKD